MILILTEPTDEHANHVEQKLQERGAEYLRFNPADFPARSALSLELSAAGRARQVLHTDSRQVDLTQVTAVWFRRPELPVAHDELTDKRLRDFVEEECRTFLQDVWRSLDAAWLPATPAVLRQVEPKASQLKLAGELGFELPPTLVTTSPEEFVEFYRRNNGNIISKPAGFALARNMASDFCRYTEVVSKRDVAYARSVRFCPAIFQAYVPKRVELRITVVGRQVFAAEIRSQESNHTRHDWRRYDHYHTSYAPHTPPERVRRLCVQLVERLGLRYGAIDMVLTPDDRYVFLEINPNGQYLWVEDATGLPISEAICDLLMAGHFVACGATAAGAADMLPARGELR